MIAGNFVVTTDWTETQGMCTFVDHPTRGKLSFAYMRDYKKNPKPPLSPRAASTTSPSADPTRKESNFCSDDVKQPISPNNRISGFSEPYPLHISQGESCDFYELLGKCSATNSKNLILTYSGCCSGDWWSAALSCWCTWGQLELFPPTPSANNWQLFHTICRPTRKSYRSSKQFKSQKERAKNSRQAIRWPWADI